MGRDHADRGEAVKGWRDWRNAAEGETIWLLGSGATGRFISPRFFDDKVVVAVNYAGTNMGLRAFHSVTNHHDDAAFIAGQRPDLPVITSEREMMPDGWVTNTPLPHPNVLKVPTIEQPYGGYSTAEHWPSDCERFTIGPTSAHLALHWAVHLGAAHIVLVGVDCGEIDSQHHLPDYIGNLNGEPPHLHYPLWESCLRDIAGRLREDGISVHSLNPFVTLALEGHTFSQ